MLGKWLKRIVTSQKLKFLNLWDLLRYSESTSWRMTTCQKSISYCNLGMRYWPFLAPVTPPCIRLARGKFELTNQDSAGEKKSSVLTSSKQVRKGIERHWNRATFLTRDGLKYPRKGIYNFKNHTSLQRVKNMDHFVFPSFFFGAKNGSPALGMATRS